MALQARPRLLGKKFAGSHVEQSSREGAMGKLGTDKRPVTGAVIGDKTAREYEHADHVAGEYNIARHGSRPKTALDRAPTHDGMSLRQLIGQDKGGLGHATEGAP